MSFWNSLLGSIFNKGERVPNRTVNVPTIVTNIKGNVPEKASNKTVTANLDSLSDADFEFMKYLNNRQLDNYIKNSKFKDVLGNIEKRVQYYITQELMKISGVEEIIPLMTIKELKPLLYEYDIKHKSNIKKAELVELVLQSVPKEHLLKIAQNKNCIILTEKGKQLTNSYFEHKEKERESLIKKLYEFLDKEEFEKAEKAIREYELNQVFARGINYNWNTPDVRCIERIKEIYNGISYDDLKNTPEFIRMLKAEIALCELLGENQDKVYNRLICRTSEEINCPTLEKYLDGKIEGGMIKNLEVNIKNLTFVYIHTKSFEASNNVDLRKIIDSISRGIGNGIEILPPNSDECRVCHSAKMKYKKRELNKIPKLPKHYGCRCMYIMTFDK